MTQLSPGRLLSRSIGLVPRARRAMPPQRTSQPATFLRLVSIPAAAPWRQSQAAALEARLGAPLPADQVVFACRRLGGWRPNAEARFALLYARAHDVQSPLVVQQEVEGREFAFRLHHPTSSARLAKRRALTGALVIVAVLFFADAASQALGKRQFDDATLSNLEDLASTAAHHAAVQLKLKHEAVALEGVSGAALSPAVLIQDLTWISAHKRPDATILGVHWRAGLTAVEVEGDAPPFQNSDRTIQRAAKPVRTGVWLWGVGKSSGSAQR